MFKKSLWFAIVMSLFVIGANFADAKGGSPSFSGGSRSISSFSSGSRPSSISSSSTSGFSSGSKATAPSGSGGFSSGSKATTPSSSSSGFSSGSKPDGGFFGFSGGSNSPKTPAAAATVAQKPDMMSKSVQQERSNNVYNSADKPASTTGTVNAGGLPPSVIGGRQPSNTKETIVIRERDRSSGPSWFPVPIWLGGGGNDRVVVVNNDQPMQGTPGYIDGSDNHQNMEPRSSWGGFWFWFFTLGVIAVTVYVLARLIGKINR